MVLVIILALVLILLAYILLAPVDLYIDTISKEYFIRQRGILKAQALWDDDKIIKLNMQLFFFSFNVFPLDKMKRGKKKKKSKSSKELVKARTGQSRKVLKVIKTFRIKRFFIDIDTGDYVQNAKLYPVFTFLDYRYGGFRINFLGRTDLVLHIQNTPFRVIKSII
ncbi:MAG: hypothetical protein KJO25_04370 [Bacteroidia bacterium]|nr:hypothetical protein [Bacteroidia bacterium]